MALNIPDSPAKRVVIIGGGFAGLALVKKLSRSGYQTVLIDRNNFHQFQPLIYQVATAAINPGDVSFPFRKLFRGRENIHFRMAELRSVDPSSRTVSTSRGSVTYDYLVLATGSSTNFFGMEDIEKNAMPMKQVGEALAMRNTVLYNIEQAVEMVSCAERERSLNIVIAGGGAAGIELAGAFSEMKNNIIPKDYPEFRPEDMNIYLIEGSDRLIGTMSGKTSADSLDLLRKMGVEVLLGTRVTGFTDGAVVLHDGRTLPTRNFIWTSGVTVTAPEGMEKCERGGGGRIVTDQYLRVKGYTDIFAVGDASIQPTPENPNGYPQLARPAIEQAQHVGDTLISLEKGRDEKPYIYTEYPVLATVGRNKAFFEYGRFRLKGFIAWIMWAVIHIATILGVRNKFGVMWTWFWNYITFDLPTRVIILQRKPSD